MHQKNGKNVLKSHGRAWENRVNVGTAFASLSPKVVLSLYLKR